MLTESDHCPLSGDAPGPAPDDRGDHWARAYQVQIELGKLSPRMADALYELAHTRPRNEVARLVAAAIHTAVLADRKARAGRPSALDARLGRRMCPTCGGSGYYPYPGNPHPNGMCDQCDGTGHELVVLSTGGGG